MLQNRNLTNLKEYKKSFRTVRFQTEYSIDAILEEMFNIRQELFKMKNVENN